MKYSAIVLVCMMLLSACHPHHARYHAPSGSISVGTYGVDVHQEGRGGPPHCPPGHRKKGWC
jgi:hypothetical protein